MSLSFWALVVVVVVVVFISTVQWYIEYHVSVVNVLWLRFELTVHMVIDWAIIDWYCFC